MGISMWFFLSTTDKLLEADDLITIIYLYSVQVQ